MHVRRNVAPTLGVVGEEFICISGHRIQEEISLIPGRFNILNPTMCVKSIKEFVYARLAARAVTCWRGGTEPTRYRMILKLAYLRKIGRFLLGKIPMVKFEIYKNPIHFHQ